ncbi:caspase family protein [Vibrio diabolicus]|uniref:caspase family protein n=1 Tax=Vibrio harveyi group TaxID=717610 RepID=UPI0006A76F10|nr:caspase family protein [Vibrio alginolyticus]HAS3030281.1 caspase family protein [Vibrio parahaemolyticus]HAS3035563.1 caspase family protein [Vibrio parahaemolyticus]HAS3040953.1 caspase family protein [Vibrio parahaemolyticus]HAS3046291.1 caspase family protein [Vibrio parahaemolyticus]HAS3057022.1 caspase family protein [Vibrio parahaemolyticus]
MRKALVVGIDYYNDLSNLYGCVNDAYSVKSVLERHGDGSLNFGVNLMTATGEDSPISRKELKIQIQELFKDDSDIALFYFAGHGYIESTGGYLISSDCQDGDDGVSLDEVLSIANKSPAKSKIIILDSCHSGIAGSPSSTNGNALLAEGLTILTASSATQYAQEKKGSGVFTSLFVDALSGGASNLVGDITPGSIYAHIDQSLGPWEQRPIFKTNVKSFTTLRKVQPAITLSDLKMITKLFSDPSIEIQLDPSFEPDSGESVEEHTEQFSVLQKYNRINLVVPVGEEHMYYAAMNSKSCKLTVLGAHYWNLVNSERI